MLHYLFSQPSKFLYLEKVKMGCSLKKWAAWTLHYLFTQPSKWTVIQKNIKLTVNSIAQKKDCKF